MDEFDDDLRLRPGRSRKGAQRAAPSFLGQVRRASLAAADPGPGARKGGRRLVGGAARGAGRGRSPNASARRVVIKARVVRQSGQRFRAAPLSRHIRYLEREGVTRDGDRAAMFAAQGDQVDVGAFADRCEGDRHHFRFIVSPEDAADLADLRGFGRDLMARVERDLDTHLDWVAIDHWNTDNPHLHILVRGKADDGRDLVISGDYIASGMRTRAQDLATLELGPRSEREVAMALDKEITADRWTGLDRQIARLANDGILDLRPEAGGRAAPPRLLGRAAQIERLGLAEPIGPARWRIDPGLEARLRDLGARGDIIKTLHRAMVREGAHFDPMRLVIHGEREGEAVLGRLVERGLQDELSGKAYAIVDGLDGRQHHLIYADLADTGDAPAGAIVEATRSSAGGRVFATLAVRSDLPLAAQIEAEGATWLDRQLLRGNRSAWGAGFGAAASEAVGRRLEVLVERGWAEGGGKIPRFKTGLIDALRRGELEAASARIAKETGLEPRTRASDDPVKGVYRRRLDLASGRFAMIDDGLGFQLVPWRSSLERHLGRTVSGVPNATGGLDWRLGRERGPAL